MIKLISRKKIEEEKYNNCLQQAINYRIYAEIWYLDALTNRQWDCYVLNDYEAIMPVPYQQILGIKIISQPIYCQQLGVFHQVDFSKEIFKEFEGKLRFRLVRGYNFNEENTKLFDPKGKRLINQVITTKKPELSYSKMVNRNLKYFVKQSIEIIEENELSTYINFKLQHAKHSINEEKFKQVLLFLQQKKVLKILAAYNNKNLVGYAVFISSTNRLIYLDGVNSSEGKDVKAASGLIDFAIKNIKENQILDFEGSSILSIQQFYSRFGSVKQNYTVLKNIPFI